MFEHDYKNYPELTNTELQTMELTSPHTQITRDFFATVVKVHDGDTVTLRTDFRDFDFPMRFAATNAPEMNETGGKESQEWLSSQLLNKDVEILIEPNNRTEKYGRLLGRVMCNGIDMGEVSIYLGYSKPYDQRNDGKIPSDKKIFAEAMIE